MLDLKRDRSNYKNLLKPPCGYEIDKILITSYTLELEKVIDICLLALGMQIEISAEERKKNEIISLHALEKMSQKLLVVCQNGKIKDTKSSLYLMLEKSIYTINSQDNRSFHPKVIIIKYKNKQENKIKYKLIVASRNLTSDKSFDVQAAITGEYNENNKKEKNISKFVKFLKNNIRENDNHAKKFLQEIENEISKVDFSDEFGESNGVNGIINEIKFLPFVTNKREKLKYLETKESKKIKSALVISPFLTLPEHDAKSPIAYLKENVEGKITLITRAESINSKILSDDKLDIYVVNDKMFDIQDLEENEIENLEENEIENEEENEDKKNENKITPRDIHAKLYVLQKEDSAELYVGSANASVSAFNGNIEAMLKVDIIQKQEDRDFIDKIKENLGLDKKKYFIKAQESKLVEEDEPEEDNSLEQVQKEFFELLPEARIEKNGENFNVIIEIPGINKIIQKDHIIEIKPLLKEDSRMAQETVRFDNMKLKEISEFYIIEFKNTKKTESKLIKIPTKNLPKIEDRISFLYSDIIKDVKGLLEYISFVLNEDYGYGIRQDERGEGSENKRIGKYYIPLLYEKMLKASYEDISKIENIQETIKRIKEKVELDSKEELNALEDLCNTFKEV